MVASVRPKAADSGLALMLVLALVTAGAPAAGAPAAGAQAAGAPAEEERTAATLRDAALTGSEAYDRVRRLTTEVGPRLAGSDGDRRAVAWALRELAAAGLANVRAQEVMVPRWERGTAEARIVTPYPQPLVVAALGGSLGTPDGGIEAEVVRFASYAELDAAAPGSLAGKIAFIDARTRRARDGAGYGEASAGRTRGPRRALELGAVGFVIRSLGTSIDRIAHTGAVSTHPAPPAIPSAALSNPDADLLAAQLAGGQPVRLWLRLTCRQLADAPSANVIGEVVGRERPEEVVLLGAHLDSWDLGTGAIDDGAGVAIVVETARRLAALPQPPRRTVRVVLFANEEHGLTGAFAYAHGARDRLVERHVAAIEADSGGGKVWRLRTRVSPADLALLDPLRRVLAPLAVEEAGNDGSGGADLIPLFCAGAAVYELGQDASEYFDVHHTVNDTLDRVHSSDLDQVVAAYLSFAYLLAELPRIPGPPGVPSTERALRTCELAAARSRALFGGSR